MSVRTVLGGNEQPSARYRAITPRDSILLSADPPLKRGQFLQAVLDILAALSAFLLASATGVGLAFAFFVLFFVRL